MKTIFMLFLIGSLMACNTQKKKPYSGTEENSQENVTVVGQGDSEKQLNENNSDAVHNSKVQQLSIEERGMQIARATMGELGKNLMGQIQKNGVIAALEFCNVQAIPLTDSMSIVHKAHIKRVSDQPRNPKNKANALEMKHIKNFKNQIAAGNDPTPIIMAKGEQVEFYYPIMTNSMCLTCHGTPGKELENRTLTNILKHYPDDKATGYSENEVRGIWSIEFSR